MTKYDLKLRPLHYACVSGGKDSLYMLNLILHNLDKYPLDMVIHYQLEIDYPFVENVITYMENECLKHNIKFVRVKPRRNWLDLYNMYGFPTRKARWCNSHYKLDAERQVVGYIKSLGCRPVAYIGFCYDEKQRFKYILGKWKQEDICYPLAEEKINEADILHWARNVELFNGWYKIFKRQGCMCCPMMTKLEQAYIYKYYPHLFYKIMSYAKKTETMRTQQLGRKFSVWSPNSKYDTDYVINIVKTKWVKKLEEIEKN